MNDNENVNDFCERLAKETVATMPKDSLAKLLKSIDEAEENYNEYCRTHYADGTPKREE